MATRRKAPKPRIFKYTRECAELTCDKVFKTNRANKIYCDDSCKFRSWARRNPRIKIED